MRKLGRDVVEGDRIILPAMDGEEELPEQRAIVISNDGNTIMYEVIEADRDEDDADGLGEMSSDTTEFILWRHR